MKESFIDCGRAIVANDQTAKVSEPGKGAPVDVRAYVEISPDPSDDPFCLCSEEGNADFIVKLNPKDFPQDRLKVKIISPASVR
jgi:hypothetical protein